jgi:hypothetical protein
LYSFVAHVVAIKVPWAFNKFWFWDADSGELIFFGEENNNGRDGFEMPLVTAGTALALNCQSHFSCLKPLSG